MTVRRLTSVLALSLFAAAVPAGTATAKASSSRCPAKGNVASSSTATVFRTAVADRDDLTGVVYGCLRSNGRITRLAREFDDGEVSRDVVAAKLSGRYVAYLVQATDLSCKAACPPDYKPSRWTVRVTNLFSGGSRAVGGGQIDKQSLSVTSTAVTWKMLDGTKRSASLAPPQDQRTKAKGCSAHRSTTLASNSTARVYRVAATASDDDFTTDVIYGCLRSSDRRTRIAGEYDDQYVLSGSVIALKLSGRYVVYVYTETDNSCKAACPPDYEPSTTTLSVVDLKTRKHRRISSGAIDAQSLKVTGTRATWTVDGETQSASLG